MNNIDFSNIGYDYGLKPNVMFLGDMEFTNLFLEAKCVGLAYLFEKDHSGEKPFGISFMFLHEEPAANFFDILLSWVAKTNGDGDAVAMDFIERNDGGYTLAFSCEIRRFLERMTRKDLKDKISPIAVLQTQFKEVDQLGQNYQNFKANYKNTDGIKISYVIVKDMKIVKDCDKHFLKKEFNFFTEENIPTDSMSVAYRGIRGHSDFDAENLPKPPKENAEDLTARRSTEMDSFFPLTVNRLKNKWLFDLVDKLSKQYNIVEITQAICNLIVFERLKQTENLDGKFTEIGYPMDILEYLLATYESFDSYFPSDDFFTEERVIHQINNDRKELEKYLKN